MNIEAHSPRASQITFVDRSIIGLFFGETIRGVTNADRKPEKIYFLILLAGLVLANEKTTWKLYSRISGMMWHAACNIDSKKTLC
jgi:hypothetical protein